MKYILLLLLLLTETTIAKFVVGGSVRAYEIVEFTKYVNSYSNRTRYMYYSIFDSLGTNILYTLVDIPIYQRYKEYTSTNVLICYKQGNQESLESAELANELWGGGCSLLSISSNNMTSQWDGNNYDPEWYDYYDCFTSTNTLYSDYVQPLHNYLAIHTNIVYIANAYKMPYKCALSEDSSLWNNNSYGDYSLIFGYYDMSGTPPPAMNNNSVKLFSFGCRTFDDTTNLLHYTSKYDAFITNGYLVQGNGPMAYRTMNPDDPMAMDYLTNITNRNILYEVSTNYVTTAPNKINFLLQNGYWAGNGVRKPGSAGFYGGRDDHLRATTKFETYPNSVAMSIESYNMLTYRKGRHTRTHQNRLFDAFDKDCNGGNYDKIFGCTMGHTMEPGWLRWDVRKFWELALQGYSYVDCFYYVNYQLRCTHIVCGNPFLRLVPNFNEQ